MGKRGTLRKKHRAPSGLALMLLLALPAVFLWEPLFTDKVLLPLDNIYQFPPWRQIAAAAGVIQPHNTLLSDLLLENLVWKNYLVQSLRSGQVPLWNPYLFAGVPFLAAGQHSALFPTTLLFLLCPIEKAFGYVAYLNFALTGLFTYLYCGAIGLRRPAQLVAAITFAFSGFAVVSVVFPMVGSAYLWLPLLLAIIEVCVQRAERDSGGNEGPCESWHSLPLLTAAGAVVVGLQFLAGHVEISYYVLLTAGAYAVIRLLGLAWGKRVSLRPVLTTAVSIALMFALGSALAGVQLVPMYELVSRSFRQTSATYEQVISWAYPVRQVATFLIPDFFGNPSHHAYRDIFDWQMHPVNSNSFGQSVDSTWWGIKNYVEAGSYVGLLPLALAGLGLVARHNRYTLTFAAGALLSLLFAFGTPAYWLPYHLLPGFRQLHSPFRWVLVYTLSVSLLAGWGMQAIMDWLERPKSQASTRGRSMLGVMSALGFVTSWAGFVVLGLILWQRERVGRLSERLVLGSTSLNAVFQSGYAFLSYEFWNFLAFFAMLCLAAAVLGLGWWLFSHPASWSTPKRQAVFATLALATIVADLFYFGIGFNSVTSARLLQNVPPQVAFLQSVPQPYRITTLGRDKLFWPNLPMLFGISDIRGYDSIIPQQYVTYMQAIEKQGLLEHNRISPLLQEASLDSPLLDMLDVDYVLTDQRLSRPGWQLVFAGQPSIYRRVGGLPRAYFVSGARVVAEEQQALEWLRSPGFDPKAEVVLLGPGVSDVKGDARDFRAAEIVSYSANRVVVKIADGRPGYLVLSDSYFPGWQAVVNGRPVPLYRANYNFRAVPVPAGTNTVVFNYSPLSLKLGLFSSLIGAIAVVLLSAYWLWKRSLRSLLGGGQLGRIARNSLTPMVASLLNKGIDVAFAMLMLRLLLPEDVGKYYFAIVMIGYFEIFTNFGLNTLLIRDVAQDRSRANGYLSNTAALRLILCMVSAPVLVALMLLWHQAFGLSRDVGVVIALLGVSLVPGNISAALSSLFYAQEQMEYPAAVSVITTIVKVVINVVVLAAGGGIVGLAAVSVLMNVLNVILFSYLVWNRLLRPKLELDRGQMREMLHASLPLMLNHMLATLFFRMDVLLLQPLRGDRAVGYYGTAYKFIDGLNIIPSTFTFAVFPVLSRYAESARDSLLYAYVLSLRLLIAISLPIAVATAFLAEPIILFFGGEQYVPYSVVALQVLIWFLPFSYVNSITQYVLIAVNQTRFITVSFVLATGFNLVINLALIPRYSYLGSSAATVLSEVVLLLPFLYGVSRHIGALPSWRLIWQPAAGSMAMAGLLWFAGPSARLVATPLAILLYGLVTTGLTLTDPEDRLLVQRLLSRASRAARRADLLSG